MYEPFARQESLVGRDGLDKLSASQVMVVGIGGVGSFTVEALARAGIGNIILVDNDIIDITNINRQIHALSSTIGLAKVDVMGKRIKDINPKANVNAIQLFYDESTEYILSDELDYVIDAIDTINSKICLIMHCKKKNIPIISAMGAGNKLDPRSFRISDISKTSVCPLARVLRHRLKKIGIKKGLKVAYSTETPKVSNRPPSSISFVPSTMGLLIASEVVKDILNI